MKEKKYRVLNQGKREKAEGAFFWGRRRFYPGHDAKAFRSNRKIQEEGIPAKGEDGR